MFFKRAEYLICFLFFQPLCSWSGGFESGGLGARATSMGGAFIGVSDDWTAIYWNPAGLARLKGKEFGASIEYVRVLAHDSQGLANQQVPFNQDNFARGDVFSQLGGEPSQFSGRDSDFSTPLPGLGFYWATPWVTWAGGTYSPLGFAFEVSDQKEPGYRVLFKSRGFIINHNLSIARTLWRGLSVGAGVNLVQASLKRTSDKTAPTYTSSASAESKTLGVQGVFGAMLNLGTRIRLGGVYRTGQDLPLKGETTVIDGRFPSESSRFTQKIHNPTTYGVGVSILPCSALTFSADWQRTQWNPTRLDVQFDRPGLILQNQDFNLGWSSTSRYRFGAEWRPLKSWSFRAGHFRDPRAVSIDSQALTGIIDPDIPYYTSGLSFHRAHWRLSLTNQYGVGKEIIGGRILRKEISSFIMEVDYSF